MAKVHKKLIVLLFVAVFVILFISGGVGSAYASIFSPTTILEDLAKDDTFDIADYPQKDGDYSLEVFQIAEGADGGLYVYVYQPCDKEELRAISINMALSEEVTDTTLYKLIYVSGYSTLYKYRVNDLAVSDAQTRYYNITSIYRRYDKTVDIITGATNSDNTKNEKAYEVGKLYIVKTENGTITYECQQEEVIKIINPYAGYIEYSNGFKFNPDWCDSHYVAFSTDKQIDFLLEATVSFFTRECARATGLGLDGHTEKEDPVPHELKPTYSQTASNPADGWFAKKYEWDRIQSVSDFKKSESLTDEVTKQLDGAQWVLRFYETSRSLITGQGTTVHFWTEVSEVTVLRLKFITAGKTYNLGAVSDKVTGSEKPSNTNTNEKAGFFEWILRLLEENTGIPAWVWKLIFFALPVIIVLPILCAVFPAVWKVVSAPFRFIAWLFKKIFGGGE